MTASEFRGAPTASSPGSPSADSAGMRLWSMGDGTTAFLGAAWKRSAAAASE